MAHTKKPAPGKPRKAAAEAYPRDLVSRTMIDVAITARESAEVLGNEFFGVTTLSFVAGFADTAGFLALYGLFTAHVTGDLITAAALLTVEANTGALIRILMIPVFMVSIAGTTLLLRLLQRRGAASLAPLLAVITLFMVLFSYAGYRSGNSITSINDWNIAVVGGLGVAAMAVQNALMRGAMKSFSPTTMMTGNLTQFTIDLVDLLVPPKYAGKADATRAGKKLKLRLKKSGLPLLGFMAGAGIGAVLTKMYGLTSLVIPTVLVAILTVITWIRSRK